ncbi:MAG: hypothetical protein JJE30_15620 [Desulfuromonadales bacterium]|nr:hypothetical protein [Desulfuromonadales bacterium]
MNRIREQRVKTELERSGWRVMTVWKCELRTPGQLTGRLKDILRRGN